MKVSEGIAQIPKLEGVKQLFCFPYTPIMEACSEAGIRPIVARQERVAGNMADGFSRVTDGRRIGVVTVQQSAGAENGFAGLAQAYADSSPILFLPGQWSSDYATLPPNFNSPLSFANQAKWADAIPSPAGLLPRMRRAFTLLRCGRPRPVLLEIPVDVANREIDPFDYTPPRAIRSMGDPQDVVDAVSLLAEATRPMIWAGQGILYARASEELTELAELLGAPVATTLLGKSGFNEKHPLSLGTASYSRTALVTEALVSSDAVFAVGASLARDFTAPEIPAHKRIVHATADASDLNIYYAADVGIVGDARLVLRQMVDELRSRKVDNRRKRARVEADLATRRTAWKNRWGPKLTSASAPINPYRVINDFMQTFDPATTIVTHDSGGPRDQLIPQYESVNPRGYLGWGHSTQLGFSLGAAMGAKLAAPEKLVAHLMGDAALGMVGMDLETAVREEIPILTIVLNNSRMGNYERMIPKSIELFGAADLGGNYSEVARGLGCHAERVEKPDQIVPAFKRAEKSVKDGKAALVEIITGVEPDIPYQG